MEYQVGRVEAVEDITSSVGIRTRIINLGTQMNKTSPSGEMGKASCSDVVLGGFGVLLWLFAVTIV